MVNILLKLHYMHMFIYSPLFAAKLIKNDLSFIDLLLWSYFVSGKMQVLDYILAMTKSTTTDKVRN